MADSRRIRCSVLLFVSVLHLPCFCSLDLQTPDRASESQNPDSTWSVANPLQTPEANQRKLLQISGALLPFPPLKVLSHGEPCIMLQARTLSLRYERQKQLDLTEQAFSPLRSVDTSQSICRHDKAILVMKFGDVENVRGLSIRLHLTNSLYESSGQWWFSLDSISLLYNTSEEAVFNVTEMFAPSSTSYHCTRVSSLERHKALLLPGTGLARRWTVTFTDFQIQAFNITSGRFSPPSDCSTFLTPAILMGLVTSLILLLVLAYALHLLVHLKHIEHEDQHKADIYFSQHLDESDQGSVENIDERNDL